jgi:hypothetical protein
MSEATVRRLRSSAAASSPVPRAKSTSTHAPSAYSPIATAPIAASAISTFMSRRARRSASAAARAIGHPPTAIDTRYSGSATTRGADASDAITPASSRTIASVVESARASRRQKGLASSAPRRVAGCARYPARATARVISSSGTSPATDIEPLPKETSADVTPDREATARSTVFAHAAQSMPSTRNRRAPGAGSAGASALGGAIGSSIGFTSPLR